MSDMNSEHIRRLDGRLISVFLELLRSHNATTASERLGLSQSAVSHALGRLRILHDDPLFIRRPHGLQPTQKATELAPIMEELAQCARRLYGSGVEFDPTQSGRRFRVASPEFVSATIGGPLLVRWSSSARGVSIAMKSLPHDDAIECVRRGEYEIAIGRYPAHIVPTGLRRELLYLDDYCVVARRDHPRIAAPLDLSTYLETGHVVTDQVGEGDPGEAVPRRLVVSAVVPAWLTALVIVASSDRLATCPRRLAEQHAETLGLQILEVPETVREIEVAAVFRDPIVDRSIEWLRDEIRSVVDEPLSAQT